MKKLLAAWFLLGLVTAHAAGVVAPDVPRLGDHIKLLAVTPYSAFGIDETRGFTRNKDGSVDVLAILVWNPKIAARQGAAMDASRLTINCAASTYVIRNDTRLDDHWQPIGSRHVIPEIAHANPNQVNGKIVAWVCAAVGAPAGDSTVIYNKPCPGFPFPGAGPCEIAISLKQI